MKIQKTEKQWKSSGRKIREITGLKYLPKKSCFHTHKRKKWKIKDNLSRNLRYTTAAMQGKN